MSAQRVYSTALNTGLSNGVDPGLNITFLSSVASSFQDPLSQTTTYSSNPSTDPTKQLLGTTTVDPYAASFTTATTTAAATAIADWTVMVYISSDNLESFAIQDFLEMAAVGSKNGVNILVQFDRTDGSSFSNPASDNTAYGNWTDTRRGLVQAGSTPDQNWGISLGELNMGDSATLGNFLNWGVTNYQAKNYGLVLWGHGNGLGTSQDETGDLLMGNEISSAIANLSTDLALVSADSCLMSTVEFASELSKDVSFFVGSQELVSAYGFEYTSVFSGLTTNSKWGASEFGRSIVSSYRNYYSQVSTSFEETISLINLKAVDGLVSAIDKFASTLMTSATAHDLYVLDWYRDANANTFGDGDYPSYVDIGKVFSAFVNYANTNPTYITGVVSSAAQNILNAYSSVVTENYSSVPGRSTGLSIYFSNKGYYSASYYTSSTLTFAANTSWDNFLNFSGW